LVSTRRRASAEPISTPLFPISGCEVNDFTVNTPLNRFEAPETLFFRARLIPDVRANFRIARRARAIQTEPHVQHGDLHGLAGRVGLVSTDR
jgi:hypothetical protein